MMKFGLIAILLAVGLARAFPGPYEPTWESLEENREGPNPDNKGSGYYTGEDFRFTQSMDGKTVYAIAMAKPAQSFTIVSLMCEASAGEPGVILLGHGPVSYQLNDKLQLEITLPGSREMKKARPDLPMVFAVNGFKIQKHYDVE